MKKYLTLLLIPILTLSITTKAFATSHGIGCGDGFGVIAKFICGLSPGSGSTSQVGDKLNTVISMIVGFLTIVAAIWFLLQFIIAGFNWISAGGDKNALETARNKMINALIGLVIVVGAVVLVGLIGRMVGLDILNPGKLLDTLKI